MSLLDIREMDHEELMETLAELKEEQFNLRFQVATNQLDNTSRIKDVKRDIARILTVLRERELASSASAEEVGVPGGTPAPKAKESAR